MKQHFCASRFPTSGNRIGTHSTPGRTGFGLSRFEVCGAGSVCGLAAKVKSRQAEARPTRFTKKSPGPTPRYAKIDNGLNRWHDCSRLNPGSIKCLAESLAGDSRVPCKFRFFTPS